MDDNKPLSYVENRISKTYPTEVGSPNFKPEDLTVFNQENTSMVRSHYASKFDHLSREGQQLLDEVRDNELVYSSKYNFQPKAGSVYHLYGSESGNFLSLISPQEWGNRYSYLGSFKFNFDGRWINCTQK